MSIILNRLQLIIDLEKTFKEELEPFLPARISRGQLQKTLFKKYNLPCTGFNMRLINDMMSRQGYKKIIIDGALLYRKFNEKEIANGCK